MSWPGKDDVKRMTKCSDISPLLPFFACDELDAEEREQVTAHLAECRECSAQLEQEHKLLGAIDAMPLPADRLNPSDILLSQCRSELLEKLDDLATPAATARWQPFGWMWRSMVLHPALSAAVLVAFGIALGVQAPDWIRGGSNIQTAGPAVNVRSRSTLSEEQLSRMAIGGISVVSAPDSGPGIVQVQLRAEQPMVISGSADDTDVRRVLIYVVENGERFDPGVRLDCMDALKTHTGEDDVRHALLAAARKDANPAVRLKALDALRDSVEVEVVREALLEVLNRDTNSGVRIEAVNLLVHSLQEGGDEPALAAPPVPPRPRAKARATLPDDPSVARVLRSLEELTRRDPNRYVRSRSAAALRQIGPRETQ